MQNFCGQARFPSGPWRNICLITHPMPKWRNGRRRGFKIPRLHGRVSSTLTLGTNHPQTLLRFAASGLTAFATKICKKNFTHSFYSLLHFLSYIAHCIEFMRICLSSESDVDGLLILIRLDLKILTSFVSEL